MNLVFDISYSVLIEAVMLQNINSLYINNIKSNEL